MIIDWSRINDYDDPFGGKIFRGEVMNNPAQDWRSRLPDIAKLEESAAADPALAAQFGGDFGPAFDLANVNNMAPLEQFIGELAMADWVDGTRQTLGGLARTTGILSSKLGDIDVIFKSDRAEILKAFDVADMVLDSKVFKLAIDAIGAIPVVGWVIRVVYEISKAVASIVIASKDAKDAAARREIARSLSIPMGSMDFDPDVNDATAKAFFKMILDDRAQDIIRPSYKMPSNAANMGFLAEGVYQEAGDDMASGWIVHGSHGTGGLGYVPGTSSMTRAMFFPAGVAYTPNSCGVGAAGGRIRDLATLYPTAQNLATSWWSQANAPGPTMYTVRPLTAKSEWENYIEQMFALVENVLKGWTAAPSGKKFTNKFKCLYPELVCRGSRKLEYKNKEGMGACNYGRRGDTLTIPKDFGRSAHTGFYAYLCQLFFGIQRPFDTKKGGLEQLPLIGNQHYVNDLGSKFYRASALDISQSSPVSSLDTLYANQRGALKSLQCMYVAGDAQNRSRFPAFYDANLRQLWEKSVTDVFSSGAWKRVVFQDMPEGEAKDAFYQNAKNNGIDDVENYNRPCAPGEPRSSGCGVQGAHQMISAGSQIPEDPSLPKKPGINGAVVDDLILIEGISVGGGKKKSKKRSSSNLPLLLAAGAIGYIFLKGRN